VLTVEQIQERTAAHYGLALNDMLSRRRLQRIVYPRQVAMYLSYLLTELSLPAVAAAFGVRHHGTVLYACRAVAGRIEVTPTDSEKFTDLRRKLEMN
jgi:chromosomal replication initiator protein